MLSPVVRIKWKVNKSAITNLNQTQVCLKGENHVLGLFICTVNLSYCQLVNTAGSVAGLNWLSVCISSRMVIWKKKTKNQHFVSDNIIVCFSGCRRNVGRFIFCQKRSKCSEEASRHTWADNSVWVFLNIEDLCFRSGIHIKINQRCAFILSLPYYDTSYFQCPTAFWTFCFPFQVMEINWPL